MKALTRAFWSNVAAVAYKEGRVVLHDRALLSMIAVQPWMMLALFSLVLRNEPANVPWAVLDQSQSAVSRRLVADVLATGYFLPPRAVASYGGGERRLREGSVLAMLVIPQEFARDLERGTPRVQLLLDGSEPISAARVGGYVARAAQASGLGRDVLEVRADRAVRGIAPLDVRSRFRFNATLSDRKFFMSALGGMLLTNFCFSIAALGLVAERESGTYEQMLALPMSAIEIVLGKLVPSVAISYLMFAFSVVVPGLLFGLWPQGSVTALVVVTFPFVLASLAGGVLVSALARNSGQAVFISVFFILPSFVLSGVMMPYQLMPSGVREVGFILPLRWYQIASRRLIERGGGFAEVAIPIVAMSALFAVLIALLRWRMRPRLG